MAERTEINVMTGQITNGDVPKDEIDALAGAAALSAWSEYQNQARQLLAKSDSTIARCYENAVAVPSEWAAYRKALRVIASASTGDATAALPVQPTYPEGT